MLLVELLNPIADWYERQPTSTDDAMPRYLPFVDCIRQQFNAIPIDVIFTADDPYTSGSKPMFNDCDSGRLRVYTGGSDHPILLPEDNHQFRAVHDYYAHYLGSNTFSPRGECKAFVRHAAMMPDVVLPVLATETIGQLSYYVRHARFAPQKALAMPWTLFSPLLEGGI